MDDIRMQSARPSAAAENEAADLTGRKQMTWNVATSWASYAVFIVAGFILPRMIDTRIGQEALGTWDFCWSLVTYFGLVQAGIVGSINVYVAGYQTRNDLEGLNRAFSSVTCVLTVMATAVLALSIAAAAFLPAYFEKSLGAGGQEARWVVLLLGLSLAVQIEFSGFAGVLTGLHRWDLHNAINAGAQVITTLGMIGVLLAGSGLIGLAAVSFAGEVTSRVARSAAAYRVCPGLRFRVSHASWAEARGMLGFGGKSFLPQVADLLLNQTTSLVIAAYLGPAALAVFSRPKALVRHVATLVSKFAYVLTPTATAVNTNEGKAGLQSLFVTMSRYSAYISFPLILTLAILGRPLLTCWMGPAYAREGATILAILALGSAATIVQSSTRGILTGINAHGRPGLADLIASAVAAALAVIMLGPLNGGLAGVAIAMMAPSLVVNALYVPAYACRKLGVSPRRYLRDSLAGPALQAVLFATALFVGLLPFRPRPAMAILSGLACGCALLGLTHWRAVALFPLKGKILGCMQALRVRGLPD